MKYNVKFLLTIIPVCIVILAAVFLPPAISAWEDRGILNTARFTEAEPAAAGYHHKLSNAEKLDLLKRATKLSDRVIASKAYQAKLNNETLTQLSNNFVQEFQKLRELQLAPPGDWENKESLRNVTSYTYADMDAPSLHVTVWLLSYDTVWARVDAETGKIFDFAVLNAPPFTQDLQQLADGWGGYLGFDKPAAVSNNYKLGYQIFTYEADGKTLRYLYTSEQFLVDNGNQTAYALMADELDNNMSIVENAKKN